MEEIKLEHYQAYIGCGVELCGGFTNEGNAIHDGIELREDNVHFAHATQLKMKLTTKISSKEHTPNYDVFGLIGKGLAVEI